MRILFDHNVPRRFRKHLVGQSVKTTREMTWDELENGELIEAAFNAGFEVLISIDKKIEHEQNLANLPLPIIVLDSLSNSMEYLVAFVTAVTKHWALH